MERKTASSIAVCLKPGDVASKAAPKLLRFTTEILASEDDDKADDPFFSEDEHELNTNELVVDEDTA